MTVIVSKIKKFLKRLSGFIPSSLPQGVTEFNSFVDSIIDIYDPKMSRRDVTFVVSTLIMRLDPTDAYKPKRYFALALHKGAAAQVSAFIMQQIKSDQAAEQQLEKQKLEATEKEASNVKPVSN